MKYLKLFTTHSDYNTAKNSLDKPNVSLCDLEEEVHFNGQSYDVSLLFDFRSLPGYPVDLIGSSVLANVTSMEIDGVKLTTPVYSYEFDTAGKHIVRFKFSSTTIPYQAFSQVPCNEVSVSDNITTISEAAFYNTDTAKITIGKGITAIGQNAINVTNLEEITIKATTPPRIESSTLPSGSGFDIFVPAESVNTYKAISGWSSYANQIDAIPAN